MGTSASRSPRSSHAISGSSGGWDTRRVALCALFVAAALVLSFVELPIFPAAPYLKYDPSGIVCLVAGLAFGPAVGAVVAALPWVAHLFVEPFGAIMALFCALVTTLVAAFVYRRWHTPRGLVAALVLSGAACLAAAILGNLVITPLYSGVPLDAVVALIVPVLIPFNLLKIAINAVAAAVVLGPVERLAKAGTR